MSEALIVVRRFAVAAMLLPVAGPAVAQEDQSTQPAPAARLGDLSLEELGNVEVFSVSKQAEDPWATPVAVSVITRDEIRRSGATSLPELLRLAPGVEVARIDASHWAIGVRGFGDQFAKSLLVLIDGRNIYTPLFAGTYWPAHDVFLEDVERVEVIRGPGGTIWGGNAVNGVINIITRQAADTRGTLVSLGTGSIDHGTAAIRVGGGDPTRSYRAYAKALVRGGSFFADGVNGHPYWRMGQTGFRADWVGDGGQAWTLQGDVSLGRHPQLVHVASFAAPFMRRLDDPVDTSGGNVLARWERRPGPGSVQIQAYYDRTAWRAPHFEETRNTVDVDYVQSAPVGVRHRVAWGGGARWSPSTFSPTVPTLDFDPRTHTDRLYSAFAQDEVRIRPERVSFTVGSKFEHNTFTGLEFQPSARLTWTPSPRDTVWAAASQAVRPPSRIERSVRATSLVMTTGPVFLQVTGSDGFESERLTGYEAGYRKLWTPALRLDVTAFHNEHDDLAGFAAGPITIETTPEPAHGLVRIFYMNGVAGTSDGFEIVPEWRPAAVWRVNATYAFRRFDMRSKPGNVDANAVSRYEGSSPRHQVRVQSRLTVAGRWEVDAAYRYVGALPALRVRAYHSADGRIGWRVGGGVELSLDGGNLLQPRHVEFANTPGLHQGIPRSLSFKMTLTPGANR